MEKITVLSTSDTISCLGCYFSKKSSHSFPTLSCLVSDEGHSERSVREQGAHWERLHSMRYYTSNCNDCIVVVSTHLTACVTSDGTGTNFRGAILKGSRFYRANLKGADFSSTDLSAASLEDTLLLDADFTDAVLEASSGILDIYTPLTQSQRNLLHTHKQTQQGAYFSASINDAKSLRGADFTDSLMTDKTKQLLCQRTDLSATNTKTGVVTSESLLCE